MKNKFIVFFVLLNMAMLNNGVAMGEKPDFRSDIKAKFLKIVLPKEVSKEEAIIIAQNYLIEKKLDRKYKIANPSVENFEFNGKSDKYTEWSITFKATYIESIKQWNVFGLLGLQWWIRIHIDEKTGKIFCVGGPDL